MAYQLLEKYFKSRTAYKPPTPIEQIAERQNGIRLRMDLPLENFKSGKPWQLGMSNWSPEGFREIHINPTLASNRKTDLRRLRFTVAHELLHCTEHLPLMNKESRLLSAFSRMLLEVESETQETAEISEKNIYVEQWLTASNKPRVLKTDEDWREWQADYFAACILMPEWSVKEEFEKRMGKKEIIVAEELVRNTADQIAREDILPNGIFEKTLYQLYDVSVRAMAIRLMSLNLIRSL